MRDLRRFATEDFPLHPSGLRTLLVCPWKVAVKYLYDFDDEHGAAGDTGSATHVAVAEFHRGKERAECLEAMGANVQKYPRADLQDAAKLFLAYAADTRNRSAKLVLIEEPIQFAISPAPEDPTQANIQVIGTLDQVRDVDGTLKLFDLKTSKKDPQYLRHMHTFQVAAYCVGASVKLKRRVEPGALILPRRYRADGTGPVFHYYPWTFKDVEQILKAVRHQVARVRSGDLFHVPGEACDYCHLRSPDLCLPALQETLELLRR